MLVCGEWRGRGKRSLVSLNSSGWGRVGEFVTRILNCNRSWGKEGKPVTNPHCPPTHTKAPGDRGGLATPSSCRAPSGALAREFSMAPGLAEQNSHHSEKGFSSRLKKSALRSKCSSVRQSRLGKVVFLTHVMSQWLTGCPGWPTDVYFT